MQQGTYSQPSKWGRGPFALDLAPRSRPESFSQVIIASAT